MSHRKKVNVERTESASVQYQNKFAQLVALVGARKTYCELGRGSAKTTDIQVERLIDIMFDMPGAPCCWVADTFSNLTAMSCLPYWRDLSARDSEKASTMS